MRLGIDIETAGEAATALTRRAASNRSGQIHVRRRALSCPPVGSSYWPRVGIFVSAGGQFFMSADTERNLRLLCAYHHPRFAPSAEARSAITVCVNRSGRNGMQFGELIDNASEGAEFDESHLICSTYHMIWNREIHVDLARPLTWTTVITS